MSNLAEYGFGLPVFYKIDLNMESAIKGSFRDLMNAADGFIDRITLMGQPPRTVYIKDIPALDLEDFSSPLLEGFELLQQAHKLLLQGLEFEEKHEKLFILSRILGLCARISEQIALECEDYDSAELATRWRNSAKFLKSEADKVRQEAIKEKRSWKPPVKPSSK